MIPSDKSFTATHCAVGCDLGLNEGNDYSIADLQADSKGSQFDFLFKGEVIHHYSVPFVGDHLLIDTLGVLALAHHMGFDQDKVEEALNS